MLRLIKSLTLRLASLLRRLLDLGYQIRGLNEGKREPEIAFQVPVLNRWVFCHPEPAPAASVCGDGFVEADSAIRAADFAAESGFCDGVQLGVVFRVVLDMSGCDFSCGSEECGKSVAMCGGRDSVER